MTPPRSARPLTAGEVSLAHGMLGDRIDYTGVEIRRWKWAFFQPRGTVMAPRGHIHLHTVDLDWREDYAAAGLQLQGLFVHEMVHVWQHQCGLCLPLKRHPFCRYDYALKPGQPFHRYGIEQQAEIVRHAFLLRAGAKVVGAPGVEVYEGLLPF